MAAEDPALALRRFITGYWISQAIYVAARLGVADRLIAGPRTCAQLAQATGAHEPSLYRLLRALASVGIFVEEGERRFALTPLAEPLRSDRPNSLRPVALMMGEEHYRAWGELLHSVQTGECAFEHMYGMPIFKYLAEHPEAGKTFDAAMTGIHGRESTAMLEAFDFSPAQKLIDIGGGNGTLLTAALRKYPHLQGVLFDLPEVIARAQTAVATDVKSRLGFAAGDFFAAVPSGGDLFLLRHIIHDWDDEESLTILKNCRQAMSAQGRLLLIETVIPPGNEASFAKLLDLNMLVLPGGQERTEAEYRRLFAAAGFELAQILPTRAEVDILVGEPRA
jgi:hypothetical protein